MGDKKNIDRLFQERFKDFEVLPDASVWDKIEEQLNEKKKKRNIIPLWLRYGAAAILLLFTSIGLMYFNTKADPSKVVDTNGEAIEAKVEEKSTKKKQNELNTTSTDNTTVIASHSEEEESEEIKKSVLNSEEEKTKHNFNKPKKASVIAKSNFNGNNPKQIIKNSVLNFKRNDSNNIAATTNDNANIKQQNTVKKGDKEQAQSNKGTFINEYDGQDDVLKKSNEAIASNNPNKTKKTNIQEDIRNNTDGQGVDIVENNINKENKTIEEAIKENETLLEDDDKANEKLNRWKVAPNAAPVYFSSLGKGSSIGSQFNGNSKNGEVNMSYGINASYAVNNRLRIRSGVNSVNLGYNTKDVLFYSPPKISARGLTLEDVITRENIGDNLSFSNGDVAIVSVSSFAENRPGVFEASNTTINQSFRFIEIPLEIEYALLDKKFGVNVIGGFSSLFLSDNNLSFQNEGRDMPLRETTDINKTSYSANLGFGLNYKVTEKINLNLEPMFKYQINTFSNTSGDFKPFFIGVYTGFGIKF